jgi:hypothetical protein
VAMPHVVFFREALDGSSVRLQVLSAERPVLAHERPSREHIIESSRPQSSVIAISSPTSGHAFRPGLISTRT